MLESIHFPRQTSMNGIRTDTLVMTMRLKTEFTSTCIWLEPVRQQARRFIVCCHLIYWSCLIKLKLCVLSIQFFFRNCIQLPSPTHPRVHLRMCWCIQVRSGHGPPITQWPRSTLSRGLPWRCRSELYRLATTLRVTILSMRYVNVTI